MSTNFVRRRQGGQMVSACVVPITKPIEEKADWFKNQGTPRQHGYHSILQRHAIPYQLIWWNEDHRVKEKQWVLIISDYLINLIKKMPNAVIKAKGGFLEKSKTFILFPLLLFLCIQY